MRSKRGIGVRVTSGFRGSRYMAFAAPLARSRRNFGKISSASSSTKWVTPSIFVVKRGGVRPPGHHRDSGPGCSAR